jgi:hypothetical protein
MGVRSGSPVPLKCEPCVEQTKLRSSGNDLFVSYVFNQVPHVTHYYELFGAVHQNLET